MNETTVPARWIKQTKNFQRFDIETQGVVGQVYIPNTQLPSPLSAEFPKVLHITVKVAPGLQRRRRSSR